MATAKDKFSSITDIRQRAVARRVARVLDLFSTGFAKMAPEQRLSAFLRAEDDAARWRNLVRIPALGMVQRLGRDLGLAIPDLHGETERSLELHEKRAKRNARLRPENRKRGCTVGRTQIPELRHIQRTTAVMACAMFDAMLADRSDVCEFVRSHYDVILADAKAEVEDAERAEAEAEAERVAKRKRRAA